jgi:rod shape-determining protein MreD
LKTLLCCILTALMLLWCQIALWPRLLALPGSAPNLLLLLVLYAALHAPLLPGTSCAWGSGCLLDVFSGTTLGFHGLIFVLLFAMVRLSTGQLNPENPLLLPMVALIGTLFYSLLGICVLLLFAEADQAWWLLLRELPLQLLLNLLAALLLRRPFSRLLHPISRTTR